MTFAAVPRKEDARSGMLTHAMNSRNARVTEQSVYVALLKQLAGFTLRFDPRERKIDPKKRKANKQGNKERLFLPVV